MTRRVRTMLRWTAVWLPAFGIAWALDAVAYGLVLDRAKAAEDWVQLLRQLGYLPTWIGVAVLLWLLDASRGPAGRRAAEATQHGSLATPRDPKPWHHRGGLVLLSAIVGGIAANVLKPLIGRLRPDAEGIARFAERPMVIWAEGGDFGLGLPSGHTTVAFAGCGMLALLVPVWRAPMLLIAAGCGLTRLFAGAHTLSDTVAGAWVGLAVAAWLFAWGAGPRRGPAGGLVPRES
jgi:membrane-associated phospholipid phosphatase